MYNDLRRLLASTASSLLFHFSALLMAIGHQREVSALQCLCRAHLHMQCAILALLYGLYRFAAFLNANHVLHVGLHAFHAKGRGDIAWPHGRGLVACVAYRSSLRKPLRSLVHVVVATNVEHLDSYSEECAFVPGLCRRKHSCLSRGLFEIHALSSRSGLDWIDDKSDVQI